eukprot:snap_masked-scaffold_4-processed-gene-16.12-mRNA-1 protein AED:1.00 eAED:1.00 QI:0/0/0/0/1/1/2/0/108
MEDGFRENSLSYDQCICCKARWGPWTGLISTIEICFLSFETPVNKYFAFPTLVPTSCSAAMFQIIEKHISGLTDVSFHIYGISPLAALAFYDLTQQFQEKEQNCRILV